jgi:plasmid stability protein
MANLQVRDINDKLYDSLKRRAELEHRSISQEVVMIIESHLNRNNLESEIQTLEFLKLSNSWKDSRSAKEIVGELRKSRSKNTRLRNVNELFD